MMTVLERLPSASIEPCGMKHLYRAVLGWDLLLRNVIDALRAHMLCCLLQEVQGEIVHAHIAPVVLQLGLACNISRTCTALLQSFVPGY